MLVQIIMYMYICTHVLVHKINFPFKIEKNWNLISNFNMLLKEQKCLIIKKDKMIITLISLQNQHICAN